MSFIKAESSKRQRFAEFVSNVFHPFMVSVVTLILVIYLDGTTWWDAVKWTAVGFGIVILPLALFLAVNVRRGRYSDWSISVREQRHTIYFLAGVCFVVLIQAFIWGGAPAIALACLYAALVTVVASALINRLATKISLHSVSMAGCTAALFWVSLPLGFAFALATLLVSWSRVYLNHHTLAQILIGWIVPAGSVAIVFRLYL